MNKNILLLNKPPGFTPLQAIDAFKTTHPDYQEETLSYAGRLDPMAEGLLLILVGSENKKRHDYEHLSKTYEFELLVGFATDTYDVMGIITNHAPTHIDIKTLDTALRSLHGKQTLTLPPYSSKPVNGKPLYWYAKRNLLDSIVIPTQEINIQKLERLNAYNLSASAIFESIHKRLTRVNGNFRQDDILKQWEQIYINEQHRTYQIIQCRLEATSGTYVRGIVHTVSSMLNIPLLTYSIKRTSIGLFSLEDATK